MDERIIKYFQDELTESEKIQLLEEAHSNDELKKELAAFQNLRAVISLVPEGIDIPEGQAGLKNLKIKVSNQKFKYYIRMAAGYAAAICLLVTATWIIAVSNYNATTPSLVQQELYVPPGQRAHITLPDGSSIWLNASSTLSYPSVFGKERRIHLSGEAYFDVAKDKKKPFVVSTQSVDVMALGTQFNVYCYPGAGYMTATLIEGSVKIYEPQSEDKSTTLIPYQQLIYENGTFRVETVKDKDDLLWKEGIYNFKSARLDTIIKKLELYYDVKIIVKDPEILLYRYTGKFRQRDGVGEIVRIIQQIHHFKVVYNEEQHQIILMK